MLRAKVRLRIRYRNYEVKNISIFPPKEGLRLILETKVSLG